LIVSLNESNNSHYRLIDSDDVYCVQGKTSGQSEPKQLNRIFTGMVNISLCSTEEISVTVADTAQYNIHRSDYVCSVLYDKYEDNNRQSSSTE
jgi:hypothetical protein